MLNAKPPKKHSKKAKNDLKLKLDSVLSPDVEMAEEDISNIIDVPNTASNHEPPLHCDKHGFCTN